MDEQEATTMAKKLMTDYPTQAFEISMPDRPSYDLMRSVFKTLGRPTGPDGEFFVVKVFAVSDH
jgi:hypothetical protein